MSKKLSEFDRWYPKFQGRGIDFYLEQIRLFGYGIEFDCIKVYDTAGDIRPPYPFQFIAYTKPRPGDDDPFEGVGGSPVEAVRDLYKLLEVHFNDHA